MKNINVLTLIIACICFYSCNSKNKRTTENETLGQEVINVYLNEERITDIGRYYKYHSFVVLETTDESVIKNVNKIHFSEDKIIILDINQSTVFLFDLKGKYLSKINKLGQGPDEYLKVNDMYFDNTSNHIFLYDGLAGKVLEYDLNGKIITQNNITKGHEFTKIKGSGEWLVYRGNGFSDYTSNKSYNNLYIYTKNFDLIKEEIPFNKHLLGRIHSYGLINNVFSFYDKDTYFLPLLSDVIYKYNYKDQKIEFCYKINFNGYKDISLNENMDEKKVELMLNKIKSGDIPGYINNFYKDGNIVSFNFYHKNKKGYLICFYDENTKKSEVCDFLFDENGLFFTPASYSSDRETNLILSIVNGALFDISKNKNKDNPVIKGISDKIENGNDANPVLIFYELNRHDIH